VCTILIVEDLKKLDAAIKESRRYVARGLFYRHEGKTVIQKEKFEERNFSVANADSPIVIHCRQPTQGSPKNDDNNHPFSSDYSFEPNENYTPTDKETSLLLLATSKHIVGAQCGFTQDHHVYSNIRRGQCDSETAIIGLALDDDPLKFCREYVSGQLWFFANEKLFTYNPSIEFGKEYWYTPTLGGNSHKMYQLEYQGMEMINFRKVSSI
jgi:hypothetical protein